LEAEANDKLGDVYQKLLQAGVDKTQSEKEAKLKETLTSVQRLSPGPRTAIILSLVVADFIFVVRIIDLYKLT
jgi:structural maintenance of chromosome 1